ncbi:sulfate transporter, partial [Salmonella enterica]|nr:sulfate transporter [Salmonella enterica]
MTTENKNKQYTTMQAPAGYWVDAKGVLTPEHLIKPVDIARDQLVGEIVERAISLNTALAEFKLSGFGDIAAFVDLSANEYGVNVGGKKGNVTLHSFDGRFKIQRAMQDRIAFDERLQAAKALIDQCLTDWTADARPEIHAIINRAFQTEKEGEVNTSAVLALRRLDITDERWLKAMDAIGEAVQVVGSRS